MRMACAQGTGFTHVTIGGGHTFGGGHLSDRNFAAIDALFAIGRQAPSMSSTLFGVALGAQAGFWQGDDCRILDGVRGCLKDFPNLVSAALLAGRSHGLPLGSSVAVLGGAGIYLPNGGGAALGLQARMDVASAVKARAGFIVSLRGAYLPNLRDDSYLPVALGVGVRFQ
jgi:hypothetical protein